MTTPIEPEIIQELEGVEAPEVAAVETEAVEAAVPVEAAAPSSSRSPRGRDSLRGRSPRAGARGNRAPRERGEFEQVTIDARRVARQRRRFNFSLVVIIGDGRVVSASVSESVDTALAIVKRRATRKSLYRSAHGNRLDPHQVSAKYASSTVSHPFGSRARRGLGGAVLDLAGDTDVVTKIHALQE